MACSTSGPVKKKWWSHASTGSPVGRHSRPAMGSRPSCSRFLVSTLTTGSPSPLVGLDLLVEVAELGIPVGVLGAFKRLDVGLQAEPFPLQQSAHRQDA